MLAEKADQIIDDKALPQTSGSLMDSSTGTFQVKNEHDAAALNARLADFLKYHHLKPILPFRVADTFRIFRDDPEAGRLNAAYLDVLLTYTHMRIDALSLCKIWSAIFSKGKLEGGNALFCSVRFIYKAEMHRNAGAFVFRYRALWDKIMGILLLRFAPDKYPTFIGAKSRLSTFKRLAGWVKEFSREFIDLSHTLARAFDDSYRTNEAHGTGVLRKWIYNMEEASDDSPLVAFAGFWNDLQLMLAHVDSLMVDDPQSSKGPLTLREALVTELPDSCIQAPTQNCMIAPSHGSGCIYLETTQVSGSNTNGASTFASSEAS